MYIVLYGIRDVFHDAGVIVLNLTDASLHGGETESREAHDGSRGQPYKTWTWILAYLFPGLLLVPIFGPEFLLAIAVFLVWEVLAWAFQLVRLI